MKREVIDVDIGAIVRDLILFDKVFLDSIQLKEFPALIAGFGVQGVMALLRSGRLRILCESVAIGQTAQSAMLRKAGAVLPTGYYSFVAIRGNNRDLYIHNCLQEFHKADAALKDIIKLKRQAVDAIEPWRENAGNQAVVQLGMDLRSNSPVVRAAMNLTLREEFGITDLPSPLDLRLEEVAEQDFRVDCNLTAIGFDETAVHKMIERGLLGLGGLNQRVEEMKAHGAISGFLAPECPLFEDRLGFLLESVCPGVRQGSFKRVVEIAGLPEFIPSIDVIDVERLLELLETKECQEFRDWIATLGQASDSEIADRVKSLRTRIGAALNTRIGRTLRFLITTGAGLVPKAGVVAGPALGGIDSFLLDWVLPKSGISTFVNHMYPSIFQSKT